MKVCKSQGCDRKHYASGFCSRHYQTEKYKKHPIPAKTPAQKLAVRKAWRLSHPAAFPKYKARWYAANVERESVRGHHYFVCRIHKPGYSGMPFCEAWNPDTGGSFAAGAQWIIAHIGRRPSKTHHLHIVDRRRGFVPENLQWVPRNKHQQEELVNRLLLENQQLLLENIRLRERS